MHHGTATIIQPPCKHHHTSSNTAMTVNEMWRSQAWWKPKAAKGRIHTSTLPSNPTGKISRRQEEAEAWPLFVIPGHKWMFSSMLKVFHMSRTGELSCTVIGLQTRLWWAPAYNQWVRFRLPQGMTVQVNLQVLTYVTCFCHYNQTELIEDR